MRSGTLLRILRQLPVHEGQRPVDLAGLDPGLDEPGQRAGVSGIGLDEAPQHVGGLVEPVLAAQRRGLDRVGGPDGLRIVQPAQQLRHLRGAGPVAAFQMQLAQQGQQADVVRRDLEPVEEHALGRPGPAVLEKEAGVAGGFLRAPARDLHGQRQPVAGELARTLAQMRLGHEGQDLGVARGLSQGVAHVPHGVLGPVGVDLAARAHLERLDLAGILGEHRVHQRVAARRVAGPAQHAGERDLGLAAVVGGFGRVDQRAHRDDGRLRVAFGEIEHGERALEGRGVGGLGAQRLELGARGLRAPGVEQELHHAVAPLRIVRRPRGHLAQRGLGGVGIASGHVPAHEGLPEAVVGGKGLDHRAQLRALALDVAEIAQRAEPEDVERLVLFRRVGHRGVDEGQGRGVVAGVHRLGDEDHVRGELGGILGEHLAGHRDGGRPVAAFPRVVHRGLDRADPGIRRIGREGRLDVGPGRRDVPERQRETRGGATALQAAGILLDETQVLAQGSRSVAARLEKSGIGEARLGVVAVELEDVAQFDLGARGLALGDQGQPALVMRLGALLRRVAARDGEKEAQKGGGGFGGEAHRGLHRNGVGTRGPAGVIWIEYVAKCLRKNNRLPEKTRAAREKTPPGGDPDAPAPSVSSRCRAGPCGLSGRAPRRRSGTRRCARSSCHRPRGWRNWSRCGRRPARSRSVRAAG